MNFFLAGPPDYLPWTGSLTLLVYWRRLELWMLDWRALNSLWRESERRRGEKVATGGEKGVMIKMGADAPFANTRRKRHLAAIY